MTTAKHMGRAMLSSNAHDDATSICTDGRNGRTVLTKNLGNPPEITPSSVTRGRAYGIFADQIFDGNETAKTAAAMLHLSAPDPDAMLHLMQLRWALGDCCMIPGCPNPHRALSLCDTHYRAHIRATRNEAHLINRTAKEKAA